MKNLTVPAQDACPPAGGAGADEDGSGSSSPASPRGLSEPSASLFADRKKKWGKYGKKLKGNVKHEKNGKWKKRKIN